MTGRVFEVREFTLQDGPGIRTTVFFKGCPLRCAWCHNPEGQSFGCETMTRRDGTKVPCGTDRTAADLARELLVNADIMAQSHGGVTFSGGEPLAQASFLLELMDEIVRQASERRVPRPSFAIETSGCAPAETYRAVVSRLDFAFQDLKHHDAAAFRRWTGGELAPILDNVAWLRASGIPYRLRVPLVPGVNDSPADRAAFARLAGDAPVEYLPFNAAFGAKYPMLGRPVPRLADGPVVL